MPASFLYNRLHRGAFQVKYLNKHMHMYSRYGLPIWLTEFACGFEATDLSADGQVWSSNSDLAPLRSIVAHGGG